MLSKCCTICVPRELCSHLRAEQPVDDCHGIHYLHPNELVHDKSVKLNVCERERELYQIAVESENLRKSGRTNLGVVGVKFSYGFQAGYFALICLCQINKQRAKPG